MTPKAEVVLDIPDHHQPRNESCAHNENPTQPCGCEAPKKVRNRKPYRRVWVTCRDIAHGFKPRIEVRIYPDGTLEMREQARRKLYSTTVGTVYTNRVLAAAFSAKRAKKRGRK